MVDYRLLLVWDFPFLSFLIVLHMVNYRLSLVWTFPFFIAFVHIAYGRLQTLASVELSIFNRFCSCHMVDHRFLASVGLAQAHPNKHQ